MRAREFLRESTTTLNKLYDGNFPDRNEQFWDEVRPDEFDAPLEVKTMPKYKLAIMLQGQYRVEHLDELVDMMGDDQKEVLERYMADPGLSQKIILISGERIIDGNHRALAAAMKGVPINYVDLADLEEQDVSESNDEEDSLDDITSQFVRHYKDDPMGMYMHAKSSYLDAVGRAKNFSIKAAELNKSQRGMSKQAFQDSVLKHFGPHLKKYGFPKHASEGWGAAEQDMMKSLTQGVTEDSSDTAEAYKAHLLKTIPQIMKLFASTGKGWSPSKEQMLAAVDTGYATMKRTGDVKQASKALMHELNTLHRMSKQGVAESTSGITPTGYTWSFEHGGEVPYKSDVAVNTFIRVRDNKDKTVLGVWADVYGDDVEIQYSEVFDKKLRGKGIYTDFLKGLAKHYNIISDQDQNNAARNIYKKLGADYNSRSERHTLRRSSQSVAEGKHQVERNGIQLNVSIDGATVDIRPMINGNQVGYVVFDRDGETLVADDLAIDEEYRRRGIAKIIYDYLKELGFTVKRSTDQLPAGKAFWDKYKGAQGQVWEDEHVDEMALATYKTMGDFTKQGPFTGADKKLVPHHKNIEKATQFFEQTPFDFRLFFSNIPGTGKYSEHGPMSPDQIRQVFGKDAEEIINGSSDAITVVYVGNKGDSKVMLTPWMMAHRFGHAINAGARNQNWTAWGEAEKYFFQTVNSLLEEHYGKAYRGANTYRTEIKWDMTPEYNALFNAMGTQRSSKSGQIRRPYEFLYELFAQYLGTGKVTLNPLPTNLGYGRKVFGNPTKFMNIKPEYRDEGERKQAADSLAYTMELLFNDVLGDSVGKIYVM